MYACVILAALLTQAPVAVNGGDEDLRSVAEIATRLRAAHAKIADVSFIYEGEVNFVGPAGLFDGDPNNLANSYQGVYAYRSDGATLLEIYNRSKNASSPMQLRTYVVLRDEITESVRTPDLRKEEERKRKLPSLRVTPLAFLNMSQSPNRFLYTWFFQALKEPELYDTRFLGWESVQGRRCLVIRFDSAAGLGRRENKPYIQYWIGMERDGHPIQIEMYRKGAPAGRTTCELELFPLESGEKVWLPVRCVDESFLWDLEPQSGPVFRENMVMLTETLRLNQGLKDTAFTLEGARKLRQVPALASIAKEFDSTPPTPKVRNDYESVQKRLDEALAKAGDQARALDASREAAAEGRWESLAPILLALAGVALLSVAGWLRWRRQ